MDFSKEDLDFLRGLARIQCEVLKYNFENQANYFYSMFCNTGNMVCYDLCQKTRARELLLDCTKEFLKEIGKDGK